MKLIVLIAACVMAAALAGCASAPQQYAVKNVYMCAAEECGPAGQRISSAQMLRGLNKLLALNEGATLKICASNAQTRNCESEGVGYYVQGGPIPGCGSTSGTVMKDLKLDTYGQVLHYTMAMPLLFNGTPLACVSHPGKLEVRSVDEISLTDEPYYCNWMAVGNMQATFSFAVELVDFDKGRIGGYWSHGVAGWMVGGQGSGYAVIEMPRSMPRGENWFAQQ